MFQQHGTEKNAFNPLAPELNPLSALMAVQPFKGLTA